MDSEFDLIRHYFTRASTSVDLGIGDDAALFRVSPGQQLAVTSDMLVSGTHFFSDADPADLGWKTLAVNLSDLAAMGATPRWVLLALSLPRADSAWLAAFSRGFFECAQTYQVALIGGDTTRGPLNLCVTAMGELPAGRAMVRSGAQAGEDIWVSGQPGRAALALQHLQGKQPLSDLAQAAFLPALHRPIPRVALGLALRDYASAALDVSDGLLGDLQHILEASGCGAQIDANVLPLAALTAYGIEHSLAQRAFLYGGDDYELLFTAPASARDSLAELALLQAVPLHRIGVLTPVPGELALRLEDGALQALQGRGFDHFSPLATV